MTVNNLSRELCEICGIEGKYLEYTTEATDGCVNLGKKRVFPDFTQSENFVKLLNFYYRFFQSVDLYADDREASELEARGEQISVQNDFLKILIFDLQNRVHGFNLDINFEVFSQGIRETEWVYE